MPKFGIDVSSFNGDINFTMIKEQIDFVIIRCGYGNDTTSQDDSKYERNVRECEALGIPYGVYFYSYALNMEDVESEIRHCLRQVRKAKPTYGVWLDMEDGDGYKARNGFPSKEMLVSISERFLMGIESAGYYAGLYASLSWLNGYLNDRRLDRFDKWVAQWNSTNSYTGAYGMWQFTNRKYLTGWAGAFDGNYAYYDYPALTAGNPSEPEEQPAPTPEGETMKVIGNGVNFREDAYVGAPVIWQLNYNTELIWLWDDGWGWSNCIYNGRKGFIANEYLSGWQKLSAYKKAKIFGSGVNMRAYPGTGGAVIGQLGWGDEISIISINPSNWMRIKYGELFAYVKYDSSYIKIL